MGQLIDSLPGCDDFPRSIGLLIHCSDCPMCGAFPISCVLSEVCIVNHIEESFRITSLMMLPVVFLTQKTYD